MPFLIVIPDPKLVGLENSVRRKFCAACGTNRLVLMTHSYDVGLNENGKESLQFVGR